MGNNIGPSSKLPGDLLPLQGGEMCDTEGHESLPATKRIVGETDSMGSEVISMCEACYEKFKADVKANPLVDTCERCGTPNVPLFNKRDWEEGSSGPVYQVCMNCCKSMNPPDDENERAEDYDDEYDDDWNNSDGQGE